MPGQTSSPRIRRLILLLSIPIVGIVVLFLAREAAGLPRVVNTAPRTARVMEWLRGGEQNEAWKVQPLSKCGSAPFLMPTEGLIGFLWDDSFYPGHRHQGIDVFGGQGAGEIPVYAAYSGYITRLETWKSSLIIRIPDDPLSPGRQIWTYYTHMADSVGGLSYVAPEFPPGTEEMYVEAGTLLGYQGNYSGDPNNPVGVHLHFSIVKSDWQGKFQNELDINNTLDPSPYLGLQLNAAHNPDRVPVCVPGMLTPGP